MPNTTGSRELLESDAFHHLVARRWRVSLLLTACLFVLYYGYILLIAVNKPLLAQRMGGDRRRSAFRSARPSSSARGS